MNLYATYKIFLFLSVVFSIFCTLNIERGYSLSTPKEKTGTTPAFLNSIFKNIQNSVVQITRPAPPALTIHNKTDQNATALGSGFIYDKEGRIITNSHVVGKDKFVDVMFMNGNRYTAKVIGQDVFNDIAVIQLSNFSESLQPLGFGNSSKLEVGEQVIAVGNPYALVGSMTSGIVSHLGRLVSSKVPHMRFLT